MSSSDIDQPAGRAEAGRAAGGAEPTKEERAAAAAVLQMIWGIHISRAVYVVAALGIADLLAGGPMTAAQLAQATQAHERSLYRVLRLLASLGVLTEHDHRSFSLTILGERLRADVPASMRSWALLVDAVGGLRSFEPTIEIVKTGKPGPDIAYGMGVFEFLAAHPDLTQKFQAAMSRELFQDAARDFIAALGGLVGIGCRAQSDRFIASYFAQFLPQKIRGVLLDVDLLLELHALAHFHKFVGVAGVAVAAAELASAVGVDGPGEGHLAVADAAVQQRLRGQREVLDLMTFAQGFTGGGEARNADECRLLIVLFVGSGEK